MEKTGTKRRETVQEEIEYTEMKRDRVEKIITETNVKATSIARQTVDSH